MAGYSRKHTVSVPTSDTGSVTVRSGLPSSEASSLNAHTSSTVLPSNVGTLDSDSDSESSVVSPIKGIRGNYKDLLAEYDEEDSEEDVDDLDRMVREMQREARGETAEEATTKKPKNLKLAVEKKQPVKRGVYGRPRSAVAVLASIPIKKAPVYQAPIVKTPVVPTPAPAPVAVPTSSLTSLSSLPPTSQVRPLVSGSSASGPSSDTPEDKANKNGDEDESYRPRVASSTSHRRHVVQDSDESETGDSSTPPAVKPTKTKNRSHKSRSQIPTSSPSSPLRSPQPTTSRARLIFSDEEDPAGPQDSTPVPVKTVFTKRRSVEKGSSDQKSSEDIDEFISSPVNPNKGLDRQADHHGLDMENYGSGEDEDGSLLTTGPVRKGLSKKEMEEMNKERARMNRERKSAITKPEARPQGMELFLSRMSKEKKERALKPQKPLNVTPQFKLPDRQTLLESNNDNSNLPDSHRAPKAEPKELMSEDSILPTSPPSESQPISAIPRALGEMLSITDSVADSDDDFQDVDKVLAQDVIKRNAALAAEEDRKRRLFEESQLQKAAEDEERIQRANFERLRLAKLKFLEKQKGGLNDVELVKKEGETEQDGVEIEPVSTEDTTTAIKTSNTVFTAKPADKDRYVSLLSRGQTPIPSDVGPPRDKRHASLAPTESQVTYAGRTFGHGTTPAVVRTLSGQKVKHHHNVAVTQQMLNQKLLEEANQRARQERMAKEAKFGRGRTIIEKQELDIDGLKKKVESRIIKGVSKDMSEDEDDKDDAEDKDWNPEGGSDRDETPTQTDTEVDTEVEDEDEDEEDVNIPSRPPKSRRILVDEEEEIPRKSLEPELNVDNRETIKTETEKKNTSSSHETDLDEVIDELGSLRPPPSSQLSRPVSDDEGASEEDEDDLPRAPKSRKRRSVLRFNDDEDGDSEESKTFPIPGSAQAKPLPHPIQATSSGPSLGYSNDGSFRDSDLVPTITESHDSDSGPQASFGAGGVEESFGGEGGFSQLFQDTQAPTQVSEESQSGGDGFGEGGFSQLFQNTQAPDPSQAAQGFGEGGFSQLFTTTQAPTGISGDSTKSASGLDLGGEDSGFSQFFGDSQAPTASIRPVVGALDQLRKNESILVPQASYLPSVSVSNTQAERDAEIVALNNLPEEVREPTQAPQRYVNKDGFFTQHKPSTYIADSPTLDTPFKSHTDPWETSSIKTPASPSRISSHLPVLLTQPANLSSPSDTVVRRLVRRQDMPLTQAEEEDVEDALVSKDNHGLSSSPTKRLPSKLKLDKPKNERSKRSKELAKEFFEAEAVESEDEGDGFGFKFGAGGDDEEEDDDPDAVVEGLVNDEEMTDEQRRLNDEARQELLRQQAEADEALRLQQAQDVAAGKLRKKHKDGADLGDDSEDEESFGTSAMRKELRRKRKLDRLDPLDALAAEPETEAFASLYQDTWKDDAAYDDLMSGGEDDASEDEHHYGDSLGIGKPKKESSLDTLKRPGQRLVASPEPMQDTEEDELPIYLDEEDEFDSQGNVSNIRRQPARPRPQPQPVQHEDEYSVESNPYTHSDPNNRRNSSSNSTKRQRLLDFAKDESQQSTAKGGSGSSVTSLKRKASVSSNSSSSESVASRRKVGSLLGARSSLLGSIKGKWER